MRARYVLSVIGLGAFLLATSTVACNGTTGDELVTFSAYAAGAAHAGDPFTVAIPETGGTTTYTVQIKSATMHIGALYLNQNVTSEACINPGLYSDQVPGAVDVDLLSTKPQPFSLQGNGTADPNQSLTLWLIDGGDTLPTTIDQVTDPIDGTNFDPNVVLQAVATNEATGTQIPFLAIVSVNTDNRGVPSTVADPGQNPICSSRVVSVPLAGANAQPVYPGDSVLLTIDPRQWFTSAIDFADLAPYTPPLQTSNCLIDTTIALPSLPDVGVTPTACIPNTTDTTFTNGDPIGANFLSAIKAGNPQAYALTIQKAQ